MVYNKGLCCTPRNTNPLLRRKLKREMPGESGIIPAFWLAVCDNLSPLYIYCFNVALRNRLCDYGLEG